MALLPCLPLPNIHTFVQHMNKCIAQNCKTAATKKGFQTFVKMKSEFFQHWLQEVSLPCLPGLVRLQLPILVNIIACSAQVPICSTQRNDAFHSCQDENCTNANHCTLEPRVMTSGLDSYQLSGHFKCNTLNVNVEH